LFLAIDNIIIDKSIRKDSINNSTRDRFIIYDSNKSTWIKIKSYDFYYQPKLQESSPIFCNSDTISKQIKKYFCWIKPGDVLYLIAYAQTDGINSKITFAFKTGGNLKDNNIMLIPKNTQVINYSNIRHRLLRKYSIQFNIKIIMMSFYFFFLQHLQFA
jgi:hypothetical protein